MFLPNDPDTSQSYHLEAMTNVPLEHMKATKIGERACICHMKNNAYHQLVNSGGSNTVENITIQKKMIDWLLLPTTTGTQQQPKMKCSIMN